MSGVFILATGGTIDKEHDPIAEALVFSEHSRVPQMLKEFRSEHLAHEVLMLKDSMEMTEEDRAKICAAIQARPETCIVVTHGTSTMPETSEYLRDRIKDKTIVLTGAMRPFSLFQSDAGFNLGGAIVAAQALPHGVYIVMNGRIFDAGHVKKDAAAGVFLDK